MLKKIFVLSFLFSGSLLLLNGCFTKPDFPFAPFISFRGIQVEPIVDPTGATIVDSTFISINYQDGDGDLGADLSNPIDTLNNFIIDIERKENGEFKQFNLPDNARLDSRFPQLLQDDKKNPIEGYITFKLGIPSFAFNFNDTIRFKIFIIDRAYNASNTILTDSIVVNQKF